MSALPPIPEYLIAPRVPAAPRTPRKEPGWEIFFVIRVIQLLIIALLYFLMRK